MDSRWALPAATFAELYHSRWRIEEAFKRIKHRPELELTAGLFWHAAQQNFGAKAVFDNLNALAAYAYVATQALLDPGSSYKINRTLAIDKIKRQIGRWLFIASAATRRLEPILEESALNFQKFVPDRSRLRMPQPKPICQLLISDHDSKSTCKN